jgi:hypothetical protein
MITVMITSDTPTPTEDQAARAVLVSRHQQCRLTVEADRRRAMVQGLTMKETGNEEAANSGL